MADQVKRNLYEVILHGRPFNMYFDLDLRKPEDMSVPSWYAIVDGIWASCMRRLADAALRVLVQECTCGGTRLAHVHFKCLFLRSLDPVSGKGYMKFSAHIIVKCTKGNRTHMIYVVRNELAPSDSNMTTQAGNATFARLCTLSLLAEPPFSTQRPCKSRSRRLR